MGETVSSAEVQRGRSDKSFGDPKHTAAVHSIEGVNDISPVKNGQQAVHGPGGVTRTGRCVFGQNAPCVQDRT